MTADGARESLHEGRSARQEELDRDLLLAAAKDDLDEARALLADGASPSALGSMSWTPLMMAVYWNANACARLLAPISDAKAIAGDGSTALMLAAAARNAEAVALLLPHSEPDRVDEDGQNALMRAALGCSEECAEILAPKTNLSAVDKEGRTAMVLAAQKKDPNYRRVLRALLRHAPAEAIELATPAGATALMLAAATGDAEAMETILKKSKNPPRFVNAKMKTGRQAMHFAVGNDCAPATAALAAWGAICEPDEAGETPMRMAARGARWEAAIELADVSSEEDVAHALKTMKLEGAGSAWERLSARVERRRLAQAVDSVRAAATQNGVEAPETTPRRL
jgi:ankyrin repeat protein